MIGCDMRDNILKKIKKYSVKHIWYDKLTKEEKEYFDSLMSPIMNQSLLLKKIYFIYSPDEIPRKCPVCGSIIDSWVKKDNIKKLKIFCSKKCRYSKKGKLLTHNRIKETNLKKYGCENVSQNKEIKEKVKQTNLEKYGCDNPLQNKGIKEKIKETNLEKYGCEYPSQNEEIKEKIVKTNLEKYGCDSPLQNEGIKEKIKETNLEKYGCEYISQNKEIREKIVKTNLEKYGCKHPMQNHNILNKSKITFRNNYYDTFIKLLKIKNYDVSFTKEDYLSLSVGDSFKYTCLICGKENIFNITKLHGIEIEKFTCSCRLYNSKYEIEIKEWLEDKGIINIETNKRWYYDGRNFHEIDLYLPEYKVGIEFNGLYWHSELFKNKYYHEEKYKYFKENNIKLIQIFENEWVNKNWIVKSIILNNLNLISYRIYARKCNLREISNKEYKDFLELNHIQGYAPAKIKLGLYYEGELVQIMSFGKPRFSKNYNWENIRSCTKVNMSVVGGFSKLLKFFVKNFKGDIITYVDVRYFNGEGYLNNGFYFKNHSNPNFFYWKKSGNLMLESRTKYQKHKLKDFDNYYENKTAREIMLENGYLRIYDAGNLVLIYLGE